MKIAVMQPYFFPYIGYFQLINVADKFVFYDDVNFIKGGWINRNNLLMNNEKKLFTLQLKGSSSFRQINKIEVGSRSKKVLKTIDQSYKKAPFYQHVMPIIEATFNLISTESKISDIAVQSIVNVADYLNINTRFEYSSICYPETKALPKADRLIAICQKNSATTYINTIAGKELYSKDYFKRQGISLFFLNPLPIEYRQFSAGFVSNLSIIDVLMFNPVEKIKEMLDKYELI